MSQWIFRMLMEETGAGLVISLLDSWEARCPFLIAARGG